MKKVIDWFKGNWFLWVFLILFYIGLRISGYDIFIQSTENQNAKDRLLKSTQDVLTY
jgi:hypothetical protein